MRQTRPALSLYLSQTSSRRVLESIKYELWENNSVTGKITNFTNTSRQANILKQHRLTPGLVKKLLENVKFVQFLKLHVSYVSFVSHLHAIHYALVCKIFAVKNKGAICTCTLTILKHSISFAETITMLKQRLRYLLPALNDFRLLIQSNIPCQVVNINRILDSCANSYLRFISR